MLRKAAQTRHGAEDVCGRQVISSR